MRTVEDDRCENRENGCVTGNGRSDISQGHCAANAAIKSSDVRKGTTMETHASGNLAHAGSPNVYQDLAAYERFRPRVVDPERLGRRSVERGEQTSVRLSCLI